MQSMANVSDTVFLVKDDQEHCFLFDSDDSLELLEALTRNAQQPDSGITREEVIEILEGIIPERLRSI